MLVQAVEAIERARDSTPNPERRERLDRFSSRLQSQAEREATPALGTLDRIHTKLGNIEAETDDQTVTDSLTQAREHVLSFLGTLEDRGMKQHREGTTSVNDDT